jgi:hypothetical protein
MVKKAITANRLRDGRVVWFTGAGDSGAGSWTDGIGAARLLDEAQAGPALEAAREFERQRVVLDVYAIDVDVEDGRPIPLRTRERIRAAGPSVRPDLATPAAP